MCLHCLGLASYVEVRELTVIRIAVKNYSGIGGIVNGLVTFGTVWSSLKNVQLFLIVNLTKIIYVFLYSFVNTIFCCKCDEGIWLNEKVVYSKEYQWLEI